MIDPLDTVTQPLSVTTHVPIRMEFTSPTRDYTLLLLQDLFGDWSVLRSWRAKHTRLGGSKTQQVPTYEEGIALCRTIAHQRKQCGYTLEAV